MVDRENGDSKFFQKLLNFYQTSQRHIQDKLQRIVFVDISIIISIKTTNYFIIGFVAGMIHRNISHKA